MVSRAARPCGRWATVVDDLRQSGALLQRLTQLLTYKVGVHSFLILVLCGEGRLVCIGLSPFTLESPRPLWEFSWSTSSSVVPPPPPFTGYWWSKDASSILFSIKTDTYCTSWSPGRTIHLLSFLWHSKLGRLLSFPSFVVVDCADIEPAVPVHVWTGEKSRKIQCYRTVLDFPWISSDGQCYVAEIDFHVFS